VRPTAIAILEEPCSDHCWAKVFMTRMNRSENDPSTGSFGLSLSRTAMIP